jgi:two-component system CheB/CheR fusion protein
LQEAYDEVQSTNEELETTNEELQSTVEELQTTNEELQSTNEEMETMNEELQSTNEELQAINIELRERTLELNHANLFMESILASMRAEVVVLDRDLTVLVWNPAAADAWGLHASEVVGRNFLRLDIGLAVAELREPLQAFLAGRGDEVQLRMDAVDRRGQRVRCEVRINSLRDSIAGEQQGVVMLIETEPIEAES